MEKQVDKNLYNFSFYCKQDRWASYWHQIDEALKCKANNILEIGVGDKVFSSYIKNNTDIKYTSMDIADDLNPDIIGSVDEIPFQDNSFDLVCAFEVLEHLPFEKFNKSLRELKRVARKNVLISLPCWGRYFSIEFRLPYFKKIRWQYKFSLMPIKHKFNGMHYWEIGKKGYAMNKIKHIIVSSGFDIVKDYTVFNMPYHHFFCLYKK